MGRSGIGGVRVPRVFQRGLGDMVHAAVSLGGGRADICLRLALSLAQSVVVPSRLVSVLIWIAQGFGVGRIPFAPGTFGSLVGLLWFALLLMPGNLWILLAGVLAGVGISVWLCGVGEKGLGQRDPGSVVMDEIIAIPICFLSWLGIVLYRRGTMPGLQDFFAEEKLLLTAGVFVAFRVFDIAKPWPVSQSQSLPGGWGVTVDDVLAAAYVNLVTLVIWLVRGFVVE